MYVFGSEEQMTFSYQLGHHDRFDYRSLKVVAGQTFMSSSSRIGGRTNIKSFFFWIKSSARRAFGECLGSKRR